MKTVIILLMFFIGLQAFAQNLDSLFSKSKLPQGLVVTIEKDSATFPGFSKPYIAIVTFATASRSVYFFVYEYKKTDAHAFESGQENYWMVSGCNIISHKEFNKNVTTFTKGCYFFLLQRCACKTGEDEQCAELAEKINKWRN